MTEEMFDSIMDINFKGVYFTIQWVSELRRKKAQEAAHGFQSLFGKAG